MLLAVPLHAQQTDSAYCTWLSTVPWMTLASGIPGLESCPMCRAVVQAIDKYPHCEWHASLVTFPPAPSLQPVAFFPAAPFPDRQDPPAVERWLQS